MQNSLMKMWVGELNQTQCASAKKDPDEQQANVNDPEGSSDL